MLHYRNHSRNVVLHVGYFYIADRTTGGEFLELCFKRQLVKSIDRFGNMYMIAVGDVVFVCDTLNHAKAFLQATGKLICGRFQRRAVQTEIDIGFLCPFLAGIVQMPHDL